MSSYTSIFILIFYLISIAVLVIVCLRTKANQGPSIPKIPKAPVAVPPYFCTMPPTKPPLVKTDTVILPRGTATYDKDFSYIIITLNNPIHFTKQEVYVSKHELEKILLELNME